MDLWLEERKKEKKNKKQNEINYQKKHKLKTNAP